jgi:hypothetical protein
MRKIIKSTINIESLSPVYTMANLSSRTTGQPFRLWVDSAGKQRLNSHHELRVKAEYNNVSVEVGFENGEYSTFQTSNQDLVRFKKSKELRNYIEKMQEPLQLHWDGEIEDIDFLTICKYVKNGMTPQNAIDRVLAEIEEETGEEVYENRSDKFRSDYK